MEIIEEVLVALRRLIRATDLRSKQLSKTVGLTAPQLLLLQTAKRHGEITIGDIARNMSLSQATVTTIVDRLEARELLVRQKSTRDKRRVYVSLTDLGETVLEDAPTALHTQLIEKFQSLESWEQSMILAALQRLANMMDAEGIDASPVLDIGELDRASNTPDKTGARRKSSSRETQTS
ncbi:MAG: MarR family transcriptional regulator [Bacteroidales bacterium]|nr:MarR family transcriptional regulator [Bacteroidales bacterium]